MTPSSSRSNRFQSRWRAPLAVSAVVVLMGAAVVAPMTVQGAQAEVEAPKVDDRIYQQFVPNTNPADDFVLPEVPIKKLPDPKPEPTKEKKTATESAAPAAPPRYEGGGSPADWMSSAGISEGDWGFVDFIASKESGWNPNATNPSSGACGLIQALPCSKVPGSGYDPVDNLRWANGYATNRYGSWAGAYEFWTANHWW